MYLVNILWIGLLMLYLNIIDLLDIDMLIDEQLLFNFVKSIKNLNYTVGRQKYDR